MDSKPIAQKFTFTCLKEDEIEECTQLVARVFAIFDPFIFQLGISKEQLMDRIKSDLKSIIDDQLVIVAKDSVDNKICGCYAGFKLSKLDLFTENEGKQQPKKSITYKKTKNFPNSLTINEKVKILDEIDYSLLKPRFDIHKSKNELNKVIFCDYYCISDQYFQTSLAKDLALNFFLNAFSKGIKHIYGSFFNIKAIKLLTKYFPAEIVHEVKVLFEQENGEKDEYGILLLYGKSESISELQNSIKAKF